MNSATILVVDDDDAMRSVLRRTLEREGYGVVQAINGREALVRMQETGVDLVITDVVMPDAEGLGLTFELRRSYPRVPVVAISGGGRWAPELYLTMALSAGASQVFAKPFVMEDLLARVRALLEAPGLRVSA